MEEKTKKRGWVKDAAIIFLAILLILTFFSSTILNRSLPEVATEYVTDGTITSKVRGTGTVVAKENYDVTIDQSHKVVSVLVKVGQEVAAGDTLMILEAGESTELEDTREKLVTAERDYQEKYQNNALGDFEKSHSYSSAEKAIADKQAELEELKNKLTEAIIPAEDTAEYEAAYAEAEALIEKLEAEVEARQTEIDAVQAEIDVVAGSLKDVVWEKKNVETQKQAVVDAKQEIWDAKKAAADAAQEVLTKAEQRLKDIRDLSSGAAVSSANTRYNNAKTALDNAKKDLQAKRAAYGSTYNELTAAVESKLAADFAANADGKTLDEFQNANRATYMKDMAEADDRYTEAYDVITLAQNTYDAAFMEEAAAKADLEAKRLASGNSSSDSYQVRAASQDVYNAQAVYDAAAAELADAQKVLDAAKAELTAAQTAVSEAQAALNLVQQGKDEFSLDWETAKLVEKRDDLTAEKTKLDQQLAEAKTDADKLKTDMEKREADYKGLVTDIEKLQSDLDADIYNLEHKKRQDSIAQQTAANGLQDKLDEIEKLKAKIEELTSEDEGTEVKSLVAGTVQTVSVSAGSKAEANKTLMTIEVPDLGYTLNFSVTNDQARRLKVGDTTTVSNFYWGSQINATLTAIKTDPQNPQGSKQLTFDVTGDVTAGSSLTLSIGEKNANYDMVVPNSAIRSDVNGSFVLKITAKNSPLGNRYFASRVNVEVIASDEKYSAISGAIEAYDSVITTASRNAPIEAGDQVRLADSNA